MLRMKKIVALVLAAMMCFTFAPHLDLYAADTDFVDGEFRFTIRSETTCQTAAWLYDVQNPPAHVEIPLTATDPATGKTYTVEIVGDDTFVDCDFLKSVTIPYGIKEIGEETFMTTGITTVDLPETLTYIGYSAFAECPLTEVTIPASVETVDGKAFYDCKDLSTVTSYMRQDAYIGHHAFGYAKDESGSEYQVDIRFYLYAHTSLEVYAQQGGFWFGYIPIPVREIDITAALTLPEFGDPIEQPSFTLAKVVCDAGEGYESFLKLNPDYCGWATAGGSMYRDGEAVEDKQISLLAAILADDNYSYCYDFSEVRIFVNEDEMTSTDPGSSYVYGRRLYDVEVVTVNLLPYSRGTYYNNLVSLDGVNYRSSEWTYAKPGSTLDIYAKPGSDESIFVEWRKVKDGEIDLGTVISTNPKATVTVTEDSEFFAIFETKAPASGELSATTEYTFDETTGTVTVFKKADAEKGYASCPFGSSPFYGSSKIRHVVFEEGIVAIGEFVFQNNEGIEDIVIPASVTSYAPRAFEGCQIRGDGFIVAEENENYMSENGSLFSKNKKDLYRFVPSKNMTEYAIPDGVAYIVNYCFTRVILDKLTLRGDNLQLGDYAIYGGSYGQIVIEEGVTSLGDFSSFDWNETSLSIPSTVRRIGTQTSFLVSPSLQEFKVADGNPYYLAIDGVLYFRTGSGENASLSLYHYPADKAGSSFSTPAGVTGTTFNAISGPNYLRDITFSEDIASIGDGAVRYLYDSVLTILNPECSIHSNACFTSHDLTIRALTGSTAEAFAKNAGFTFESMGDSLGKLDPPTNLRWEGHTVLWDAVPEASRYEVKFFAKDKDGYVQEKGSFIVNEPSFTYPESEHDAFWYKTSEYWVTVSSGKAGYDASDPVTSTAINGRYTLRMPAAPTLNGNVISWEPYVDDEGNTVSNYWLSVTDLDGHTVDKVHSAWGLSTTTDLDQLFQNYGVGYGDYVLAYAAYIDFNRWTLFVSDTSESVFWHYGLDITGAVVSEVPDQTFTGTAIEPAVTVSLDGTELTAGTDYAVSYQDNTNAGTASVTITGIGIYTGSITRTFTILPKAITPTVTLSKTSYTYNGSAKKPSTTVKDGDTTLVKDVDYTVKYASGRINAGTYKVTVTLQGNYSGTKSVSFTIAPKAITPTVTLSKTSYTYNGSAKKPSVTVKDGDTTLVKDVDYTVKYASGRINVGTYKVTVTLQGNYSGSKSATFTITPKSVTPTVTLSKTAYTFSGTAKKPGVTVKDGDTTLVKDVDYTVKYASGRINVGKYKVTVTLKGNYTGTKSVTFKINPKGTTLKSLTAASKALTVKWEKQSTKMASSRITGYQIQLATNSGFTSNKKTVTVSGYDTVSKKVTNLLGGKKYYVRIRTYKTVSGTKYYSSWSAAKTQTTKK